MSDLALPIVFMLFIVVAAVKEREREHAAGQDEAGEREAERSMGKQGPHGKGHGERGNSDHQAGIVGNGLAAQHVRPRAGGSKACAIPSANAKNIEATHHFTHTKTPLLPAPGTVAAISDPGLLSD